MIPNKTNKEFQELLENPLFNTIINASDEGFFTINEDLYFTFANNIYIDIIGYSIDDLKTKRIPEIEQTLNEGDIKQITHKVHSLGSFAFDTFQKTADGTNVHIHIFITFDVQSKEFICFCRDITELQTTKNDIIEKGVMLRNISDNIPDGYVYQIIIKKDLSSRYFSYISEGLYRVHGLKPVDVENDFALLYSQITPDYTQILMDAEAHATKAMETFKVEATFNTLFGTKWLQISSTPRLYSDDEVIWDGVVVDITSTRQLLSKLTKSEDRLQKSQELAKIGSWELHIKKNKLYWSDEIFRIFDIDKTMFRPTYEGFLSAIHPEDRENVHQAYSDSLANKTPYEIEHRLLMKDGSIKYVQEKCSTDFDANDHPIISCGTVQDISDRIEKTQENENFKLQLDKMQRLDSLGSLAGGIAHDFNNLLGGIFGNIDLAKYKTTDETVKKYLDRTLDTIDRAKNLTQQLLTFAKGGEPNKQRADIKDLIHSTVTFALTGSSTTPHFDIDTKLHMADFDKGQIEQVIDNIVINAKQAMGTSGTINVKCRNEYVRNISVLPEGNYITIAFHDNGTGIPDKIIHKLFDPYFTTKENGHGLGLATCYSIIKRHGGTITVQSEIGEGTTFTVYLPAVLVNNGVEINDPKIAALDTCRHIIVMDDEEMVLEITCDMLEELGHTTTACSKGEDVIKLIESTEDVNKYDAAVLDLTIVNGMNGKETAEYLHKKLPHLPLIVFSGYSDNPIMAQPEEHGFRASIKKPFQMEDFKNALSICLKNKA